MKYRGFFGFAIGTVAIVSIVYFSGLINRTPASVVIEMRDDAYEPMDIQIVVGQSVDFMNVSTKKRWPASDIHPTHAIYPEFNAKRPIEPGEVWTFEFDKKGNWRYHDEFDTSIQGVITVN